MKKQSGLGYVVSFALGLLVLTGGAFGAFWQVTGSEVVRSAAEAAEARRPAPEPPRDTTPEWQPAPEAALRDSLFLYRSSGQLDDALRVAERWLDANPDDRPIRLEAARIAFEAIRRQRGVFHYRVYLLPRDDDAVLREAVSRFLSELQPADARKALATILRLDAADFPVRIGLARATAEAGDPEGADTLMRPIPPYRHPEVDALRLLVRRSIRPDLARATQWVAEYPGELLYRLVLARALAGAGRPAEALEHYVAALDADSSVALREETADAAVAAGELGLARALLERVLEREPMRESALLSYGRVLARAGDGRGAVVVFERLMALNPDEARFAEARGLLFEVEDPSLTLPLLARLVAFRPTDDVLRLRYAQDLERTGQLAPAEVQYDTLLTRAFSAPLLMVRARLRAAQNRLEPALADAKASEAREPSLEAALMQAEIHRWQGERLLSRLAYDRAARFAPADARIAEGRRLLAQQRRDALSYNPDFGALAVASGLGDSDGYRSASFRVQHGSDPFTSEALLIVGAEMYELSGPGAPAQVGVGGDVGLGAMLAGLEVLGRVGALALSEGSLVPTATLEVLRRSQTRSLRAALLHDAAFETLRSARTASLDGRTLGATTLLGSTNAELGPRWDVYAQADHTFITDGNTRSTVVGAARVAVRGPLSLLVSAGAARYAAGTADYWSPQAYLTQGVGVELRQRRARGWSAGARVSPALAWVKEDAPGRPTGWQTALQSAVSVDATWRGAGYEIELFGGHGRDRSGTYAAGFGGLRARRVP